MTTTVIVQVKLVVFEGENPNKIAENFIERACLSYNKTADEHRSKTGVIYHSAEVFNTRDTGR